MCEICSKSTITTTNDVIDVVLAFLLLTLNIFQIFFSVSIADFEQVIVSWDIGNTNIHINLFMHNDGKWLNILLKSCSVHTTKLQSMSGCFSILYMKVLNITNLKYQNTINVNHLKAILH